MLKYVCDIMGKYMNRKIKRIKQNFKDMDKLLFIVMLSLIIFGTFNIVTASSRETTNIFFYFYRQIIILTISVIGFIFVLNINTKRYNNMAPGLFIIAFCLNLYLIIKGSVTRGALNWIDLGFFKLQPSEVSKPIIIVCLAVLFENWYNTLTNKEKNHSRPIWIILIVGMLIPLIVYIQRDIGTCLILVGIFGIMYLSSPILTKEKFKYIFIALFIVIFALMCKVVYTGNLFTGAQLSRFNYFNPCSKYEGDGYQICNAFIAINNGGLTGVGMTKSTQKYSYIPEPHTDMVFSIIAEENGVIMCSLIFIAYLIILYRILLLSSKVSNIKNRYICIGVATYIFLHILINLGGLFGLIPLTGVPLPFLSYGGSFTLSLIVSMGIIQRIYIENKNKKIL